MAISSIIQAANASRGRVTIGNISKGNAFKGMRTVPYNGVGEQLVENMQLSTSVYRKMYGNKVWKDMTATFTGDVIYVFPYNMGDDTYQTCIIYKDGSGNYKFRAIDSDGAVVTPSAVGAYIGDPDFLNASFSWTQIGFFGYLSNKVTTSLKMQNWDGIGFLAVANSPDSPEFVAKDGRRLVVGAEGIVKFSGIPTTTYISDFTAGTGASATGTYTAGNIGLAKSAVGVQGSVVIFWDTGAELHSATPADSGTAMLGDTRKQGFHFSGTGINDKRKVVSTPKGVYFVNSEGLWKMDPYNGSSVNLVKNAGSIENYWQGLDLSDSRIEYYPEEEMVVLSCREQGEGTNDRFLCYHIPYESFYFKTRAISVSLANVGGNLYYGSTNGKIYKAFDKTTYRDGNDGIAKSRIITEWNAVTNAHTYKSFRKGSVFASLHPDSSFQANVYQDGFTDDETSSKVYTTQDASNNSGVVELIGMYVVGIGKPDDVLNTDVVKRSRFLSRFITFCYEIIEESDENFEINSMTLDYAQRGTDVYDTAMADQKFALSS